MAAIPYKRTIRIVTYMCPTHPVQLYELIVELLEKSLNCYVTLQYESRAAGPLNDRPDPFTEDSIDIAFMSATSYLKLKHSNNQSMELLPVTPVFSHPKNTKEMPGYYADIIVHADKKSHNVNTMMDLRGSVFAYSDEESLSGCKAILKQLHEKGENATFFGTTLKSGSHMASAQMVLTKTAEWASVDSTTLLYSKKYMQDGGKDILVLDSFGPLPPYPIIVNSRLPVEIKRAIITTFLNMTKTDDWVKRFLKYGIVKYAANSDAAYADSFQSHKSTKNRNLSVPYY